MSDEDSEPIMEILIAEQVPGDEFDSADEEESNTGEMFTQEQESLETDKSKENSELKKNVTVKKRDKSTSTCCILL